jgi:8-oxo-dGTP diphosphatase
MKKKVLIYIARNKNNQTELLVFQHRDFPEAGIQVPGGTVKVNERPDDAAIRETKEESGVSIDSPKLAGVFNWFRRDKGEFQERHIFHVHLSNSADSWTHKVAGNNEDEDRDLIFNFYWVPITDGVNILAGQQGLYLPKLGL